MMINRSFIGFTAGLWLLSVFAVHLAAADLYMVKDLGTLGGSQSWANAINSVGQVVGRADTSGNAGSHATLFSGTGVNNIDLGILGTTFSRPSEAFGINDSGQVVGYALDENFYSRAVRFSGTGVNNTDLGTLPGDIEASARAINNGGEIVGFSHSAESDDFPNGIVRAVLFGSTGNTQLSGLTAPVSVFDNTDAAYAINRIGQTIGRATNSSGVARAVLFNRNGNPATNLGSLQASNTSASIACAINDLGQIVGRATKSGGTVRATLFSGTGSNNTDLGALVGTTSSYAYAINNSGVIVGNSYTTSGAIHGFVYRSGVMTDLNDAVINASNITDIRFNDSSQSGSPGRCINDAGQIGAIGTVSFSTHALLLTPILPLRAVAFSGNNVVVTFTAAAGNTYRLERKLTLADPTWHSIAGVNDLTASTNGSAQIVDPGGRALGTAFYRVRLLPPNN